MKKFNDNLPIYLQLKAEVEDAILTGSLKPEDSISSIRQLAAQYAVNPLTVAKAVNELEADGTIYKKRGIGFFVSPEAPANLRQKHLQTYLEQEVQQFVRQAAKLGIRLSEITDLIARTYQQAVSGNTEQDAAEPKSINNEHTVEE